MTTPDGEVTYTSDIGAARVIRTAAGMATVIMQVPKTEMDAWMAAKAAA